VARTRRPRGRTRNINFYLFDARFTLVHLPGYGFAVGPEAERRGWGPLVEGYLRARPTLRGVVVIVDARRGLQADEEELLAFLDVTGRPAAVVATKLDKLARAARDPALAALARGLGPARPVVGFSAHTGEGRDALWRVIGAWV
jgi:GTP-binding protein